jgi:hypothetical protein
MMQRELDELNKRIKKQKWNVTHTPTGMGIGLYGFGKNKATDIAHKLTEVTQERGLDMSFSDTVKGTEAISDFKNALIAVKEWHEQGGAKKGGNKAADAVIEKYLKSDPPQTARHKGEQMEANLKKQKAKERAETKAEKDKEKEEKIKKAEEESAAIEEIQKKTEELDDIKDSREKALDDLIEHGSNLADELNILIDAAENTKGSAKRAQKTEIKRIKAELKELNKRIEVESENLGRVEGDEPRFTPKDTVDQFAADLETLQFNEEFTPRERLDEFNDMLRAEHDDLSTIVPQELTPAQAKLKGEIYEYLRKDKTKGLTEKSVKQTKWINEVRKKLSEIPEGIKEAPKSKKGKKKGGPTFQAGIPSEEIGVFFNKAMNGLKDALGIKEPGVRAKIPKVEGETLGFLKDVRSMTKMIDQVPSLKKYVEHGHKAVRDQNIFADEYFTELNSIDRTLRGQTEKTGALERGKEAVTPSKRRAYKENRSAHDELIVEGDIAGRVFSEAELKEQGYNDVVIDAYQQSRALFDRALLELNEMREANKLPPIEGKDGYFPHVFHNVFILVDKKIVGSAKNFAEAISIGNKLKREGAKSVDLLAKRYEFEGEAPQAVQIGDLDYFRMEKQLTNDFEFTLEAAQEMMDMIVHRQARSRKFRHAINRKDVPGYEKSVEYVTQHYFKALARFRAMDLFKRKTNSLYQRHHGAFDKDTAGRDVAKFKKDYINDVLGVPTLLENRVNGWIAESHFGGFLKKHMGDRPGLQISTMEGNFAAITKLGLGNASSAVINATQILNTQAILNPIWAARGVSKLTLGEKIGGRTIESILHKLDVKHDLGLESGNGIAGIDSFSKLAKASLIMFTKVEYFNRATAGLGAYAKAFEGKAVNAKGVKVKGGDIPAAEIYAREVIERSQFNYSIANAPNIFRRASGSIWLSSALRFKKFPAFQAEFILTMKGAEHAKFWFPTLALSGYYGIPGSIQLDKMLEPLFGYSVINKFDKFLIEWAGKDPLKLAFRKQTMYGVLGNVGPGVDISQRTGIPEFGFPRRLSDLAGSTANSLWDAFFLAIDGKWNDSMRALFPGPGNFNKAVQMDDMITSPWKRDRGTVKVTPGMKAVKALGFRTTDESDSAKGIRIISEIERKVQEDRITGVDLTLEGLNEDDDKKWDEGLRMIREEGRLDDVKQIRKSLRLEQRKKGMTSLARKQEDLSNAATAMHMDLTDALTPDK